MTDIDGETVEAIAEGIARDLGGIISHGGDISELLRALLSRAGAAEKMRDYNSEVIDQRNSMLERSEAELTAAKAEVERLRGAMRRACDILETNNIIDAYKTLASALQEKSHDNKS